MLNYQRFELKNGLKVFVHTDKLAQTVAFNLCYKVGSRDEQESMTGFAHLFEHLMFSGSANVPSFDTPLQNVGAQNNAFTNVDLTNYYITLPLANLETAFWIESDRMKALNINKKSLDVQKKVVIEEFKQRYLNQPYGDVWLNLRPLVYKSHPYKWATIGKDIKHIETAKLADVKAFFSKYYVPNNAVLVIAGNVDLESIKELSEKWFGDIEPGVPNNAVYPDEPVQTQERRLALERNVPANTFYMAFPMSGKFKPGYFEADILTEILGQGKDSRLYKKMILEEKICSGVSSFQMGALGPNLFLISGTLKPNVSFETVEKLIWNELNAIKGGDINESEIMKIKTQARTSEAFSEIDLLNRAMKLAFAEIAGHLEILETEMTLIEQIQKVDLIKAANEIFVKEKSNLLTYGKH
jgi:zinc protease